ncbi:MAG: hypothetical protein WCA45_10490 [Thiobacillaceae bacterium]
MFLPLTVTLRRSRILLIILPILHGSAAWAVALTALPIEVQGGLLLLLALSMAAQGWRYRYFPAGRKILALSVDRKSGLWLDRGGAEVQAAELDKAWLGPGLGVVTVRSGDSIYRVLWLPDSADAQALRRWRVWLHWG